MLRESAAPSTASVNPGRSAKAKESGQLINDVLYICRRQVAAFA
jgi:hypothetical protein